MGPIKEALTFDDVTLTPKYSSVLPSEVKTETFLTNYLKLKIPLITSAMDTVTESRMAIAIAKAGGIGIIHRNLSIKKQVSEIKKVKSPKKKSQEPVYTSYVQSIYKVLFADITISFDNVIGVVGAAKGNIGFMIYGLVLSVILTGAGATYLANYIQKHIWIAYIGLAFILLVAIQLIIGGLVDLEILQINEQFKKYF